MSDYNREILESIRIAAGTNLTDELRVIQARVTNVDPNVYTCDCTPINSESTTPFLGVNLSANSNDGFILIPKEQSIVLVAESTKNNPPFVIGCSTIKAIICVVQNADNSKSKFLINYGDNNTIQFNDGSYGGLVILQKVLDNLNTIKNYLSTLNTAIETAFTSVGESTAASGSAGQASFSSSMSSQQITFEDMENSRVKHGA